MAKPKFHLYSFSTCPYLQSIVIHLKEKKIAFDLTYIDLEKKPEWVMEKVPMGRVPILQTEQDFLFESSAINEYIEDISDSNLRPKDPIGLAKLRAWVVFIQDTMLSFYKTIVAITEEDYNEYIENLAHQLLVLDGCTADPFFMGEKLSLLDIEMAPLLYRIQLIKDMSGPDLLSNTTNLQNLSSNLMHKKTVKESVPKIFNKAFIDKMQGLNGHMAKLIKIN